MLRNITLSADERVIHQARERAMKSKKSLNVVFREWLARYAKGEQKTTDYYSLMKQLSYVKAGKHFSRDELNER